MYSMLLEKAGLQGIWRKGNRMFDLIDEISELLYVSDPGTYTFMYGLFGGHPICRFH